MSTCDWFFVSIDFWDFMKNLVAFDQSSAGYTRSFKQFSITNTTPTFRSFYHLVQNVGGRLF